jgi:hypothetical protein
MRVIPNEVWCRTCGYYRPVKQMSIGKQSEFNDRINYKLPENLNAPKKVIDTGVNIL